MVQKALAQCSAAILTGAAVKLALNPVHHPGQPPDTWAGHRPQGGTQRLHHCSPADHGPAPLASGNQRLGRVGADQRHCQATSIKASKAKGAKLHKYRQPVPEK